jgi:hypothetical protein
MTTNRSAFQIMATCFSGNSYFDYNEEQRAQIAGTYVGNMGRSNSLDCISFAQNSIYGHAQTETLYFESSENKKIINSIIGVESYNSSGLIPPGLVSLGKNVLVFENPPTNKLISHTPTDRDSIDDETEPDSYYMPIPWQVYVCVFNNEYVLLDTYMFYTRDAISKTGFDQPVYSPVLPNFFGNGQLCRPFYPTLDDVDKYSKDISGVIASAYDSIWNSGWNLDLYETLNEYFILFKDTRLIDADTGVTDLFRRTLNPILKQSLQLFESQQQQSVYVDIHQRTKTLYATRSRNNLLDTYCSVVKDLTLDQICSAPFPAPSFERYADSDSVDRDELHEEYMNSCDEDEYSEQGWEEYYYEHKNATRFANKSFESVLNRLLINLDGILGRQRIDNMQTMVREINNQAMHRVENVPVSQTPAQMLMALVENDHFSNEDPF